MNIVSALSLNLYLSFPNGPLLILQVGLHEMIRSGGGRTVDSGDGGRAVGSGEGGHAVNSGGRAVISGEGGHAAVGSSDGGRAVVSGDGGHAYSHSGVGIASWLVEKDNVSDLHGIKFNGRRNYCGMVFSNLLPVCILMNVGGDDTVSWR